MRQAMAAHGAKYDKSDLMCDKNKKKDVQWLCPQKPCCKANFEERAGNYVA